MLSEKYRKAILQNRVKITQDLLVEDILSNLRTNESFNLSEYQSILLKKTSQDKAEALVDLILSKNDAFFELFLEELFENGSYLADDLHDIIDNYTNRKRRNSATHAGELLIEGGFPDRVSDYIQRIPVEKQLQKFLAKDDHKPILVHGSAGVGKSTIVVSVLHSNKESLLPDRFHSCCWMYIGNIKETDVMPKLTTLLSRLSPNFNLPYYQNPEVLQNQITKVLRENFIFLVIDGVCDQRIMPYFMFSHIKYIVTSRINDLFPAGQANCVEVPPYFDEVDCKKFLNFHKIDKLIQPKIIEKSRQLPLHLSMLAKMANSNSDFSRNIDLYFMNNKSFEEIFETVLDKDKAEYCKMLLIFDDNQAVSVDILTIYWNTDYADALNTIEYLINNNLVVKKFDLLYSCNMYCLHGFYRDYLAKKYENQKQDYKQLLINRHKEKIKSWLDINYRDPYILMYFGRMLSSLSKKEDLGDYFTDFSFIAAKIALCGITDLLFDYEVYRPNGVIDLINWNLFERFFQMHNHKFVLLPKSKDMKTIIQEVFRKIIQLGLEEKKESVLYNCALESIRHVQRKDFWNLITKVRPSKVWTNHFQDTILLVDINRLGILFALEGGILSLQEMDSPRIIFSYKLFDGEIILCQFLEKDSLSFVVGDTSGNILQIKIVEQLPGRISPALFDNSAEIFDDDQDDYQDDDFFIGSRSVENYIPRLHEKFRNINVEDFKRKYTYKKNLGESRGNRIQIKVSHGFVFGDEAIISWREKKNEKGSSIAAEGDTEHALIAESGPVSSNLLNDEEDGISKQSDETFTIARYRIKDFQSAFENNLYFQVKKILCCKDNEILLFYTLKKDGSGIVVLDEFLFETRLFKIEKKMIVDFIVIDNDIYSAVDSHIYKNEDILFSTKPGANCKEISLRRDNRIAAVSLTDNSFEIWDLVNKRKIYSLPGLDVDHCYFVDCMDYLITVGKHDVAKWQLNCLNLTSNRDHQLPSYRPKFYMKPIDQSSISIICQSLSNKLEYRQINLDGKDTSKFIDTDDEATYFSLCKNYIFVGFLKSGIKVYTDDLTLIKTINTVENVHFLYTKDIGNDEIGLFVHADSRIIQIYKFSQSTSHLTSSLSLDHKIDARQVVEINNDIIVSIISNNICQFYRLNSFSQINHDGSKISLMTNDNNYFALSDYGNLFCSVSASGKIVIWNVSDCKIIIKEAIENSVLRKCKFRPNSSNSEWNLLAIVDDNRIIYLLYFVNNEHFISQIEEDSPLNKSVIFTNLKWSSCGTYLLTADFGIRKWRVPQMMKRTTNTAKLRITELYTFHDGCGCLFVAENFICVTDQAGYMYIFTSKY